MTIHFDSEHERWQLIDTNGELVAEFYTQAIAEYAARMINERRAERWPT